MNYLNIVSGGRVNHENDKRFEWDVKLMPAKWYLLDYHCGVNKWESWLPLEQVACVVSSPDQPRKILEWHQDEIDVSDIPPSVLFLWLINRNSRGLSLYIPLDMSFPAFCEWCIKHIESGHPEQIVWGYTDVLDFDYLARTGKVRCSLWNENMYRRGCIWIESGNVYDSIQSVVTWCKQFMDFLRGQTQSYTIMSLSC